MSRYSLYLVIAVLFGSNSLLAQVILESNDDTLPEPGECGILKPDQLYNLEKLVEADEFPWMARLRYNLSNNIDYGCLAVLISRRHLIAPAHCFKYSQPDAVLFGKCEDKCKVITDLDHFTPHPGYQEGKVHDDIGLLRLKRPLRYSYFARPICLPADHLSEEGFVAHHLMSTGFVRYASDSNKRFLLVVGLNHCRRLYKRHELADSLLCASTCDNGSRFISGSVLMGVNATRTRADHYYFIGLLTFGRTDCVDYTPDVFQRIDGHLEWIRKHVH